LRGNKEINNEQLQKLQNENTKQQKQTLNKYRPKNSIEKLTNKGKKQTRN